MSSKNQFGLSRDIDPKTKRIIRQNSKFGCVVPNCRNAFYEYEHIIPEFKDALEHNPDRICLVCSNHNPRKHKRSGPENYSKEQLQKYYDLIRNTSNVPEPINNDFFNGFDLDPEVIMGACSFQSFPSLISVDGQDVFSFVRTAEQNPFAPDITFTGRFNDSTGNNLFQIIENEWTSPTSHWDVITKDGEMIIWDSQRKNAFHAKKYPDKNQIKIMNLDMWLNPFHIYIENEVLSIRRFYPDVNKWVRFSIGGVYSSGKCGVHLDSRDFPYSDTVGKFMINGGETTIQGSGITVGQGTSSLYLRYLAF